MSNIKLIPFALLALSQSLFAQQPPSAGSQMQQIPRASTPQKVAPKVEMAPVQQPATAATADQKITVNQLRVTGAQAYSEADLLALTGFQSGRELSLTDLRAMATRVADHYHRNGYFVAQAYLPAQNIENGRVTIAVIEGQYGQISLNNQTTVSNDLAGNLLGGLKSGDPVTAAPLETRLLLLSDLPGVTVKSSLKPGATAGTSDLVVDMIPGQRVTGSIDADNAGNRYTGEYRIGATINLNEPTGHGDVATLRALTSGPGLQYLRGAYQMQFGKATAGVAYSALRYELGREFESLGAHGTAQIASVFGRYPLIRSRHSNLYAGLNLDAKKFQDKVDSTASVADKQAQVLTASLHGDHHDSIGGGGVSTYSLAWSAGNIDLKTPSEQSRDAITAQSSGRFNKVSLSAMRLQRVTDSVSVSAAINGQLASKNLDISEKMELGGMYGVRAYPEGEAFGDEGYVLNLEARMALPQVSERMAGQMQLIGFIDSGSVTVNKTPWVAGPNRRNLSGAGVGLNWTVSDSLVVKAYYARKLGNEVATSAPDRSGRFWIQAVKYF